MNGGPRFYYTARIDLAGNLNFRGLTGYDGKKREDLVLPVERISFSRIFLERRDWRETFSSSPYSIVIRRIIIHVLSRIVLNRFWRNVFLGSVTSYQYIIFGRNEEKILGRGNGWSEISFLRGMKLILFFVIALTARDVETIYFRYIIL